MQDQHLIAVVPTTRAGAIGAVLAAIAVVAFVLAVVTDGPESGRGAFAVTWALVLLSGAVEVFAITRRGERSIVGYVALIPTTFLGVLLFMEATGLIE